MQPQILNDQSPSMIFELHVVVDHFCLIDDFAVVKLPSVQYLCIVLNICNMSGTLQPLGAANKA